MEWVWYISGLFIGYAYVGYPILLWLWSRWRRRDAEWRSFDEWPTVSLIVPAYNEADFLPEKLKNVLELDYPAEKLEILFAIEGSTDGSEKLLSEAMIRLTASMPRMKVLSGPTRRGKRYAIEAALEQANGEIIVISDANTLMPQNALKVLILPFQDPEVGAVAGEKRVVSDDSLPGEGESLYWRYESFLKTHMTQVFGCIGTVGELFAVRKALYPRLRHTNYFLLEDMIVSMEILRRGKRVEYAPQAYSIEAPSLSLRDELKRKVRIAATHPSTLKTYPEWLYFWKHPHLFFHFFSYKLLRWYVVPLALPIFFVSNILILHNGSLPITIMGFQIFFYLCAVLGLAGMKHKVFRVPSYFLFANFAQVLGIIKYFTEHKTGTPYWEKVQRKTL